jgi:hypothetical protein
MKIKIHEFIRKFQYLFRKSFYQSFDFQDGSICKVFLHDVWIKNEL